MRVLVIGAGLAGLAATERLLDAGVEVVVIDAFPRPGGRTANFDVSQPVAGLVAGDMVEHGLHAWFQHYRALFGLMERADVAKPPFAGRGLHLYNRAHGHVEVAGGPFVWLYNALRLPHELRGDRRSALQAFGRLIGLLDRALAEPEHTDRETAAQLFAHSGVPEHAVTNIFGPCLYSLTSLRLSELSALEMLRWMSAIIPDPRIRCLQGGGTTAMCAPIAARLVERGASLCLGVEVTRLWLADGRVQVELAQAPDRTGLRHILVPGFTPATPPDPTRFDAIVCSLPWERLLQLSEADPGLMRHPVWENLRGLENVHPLTIRLWFEHPIADASEHYILSKDTLFDVVRPTREPDRYPGIHLIDALVENIDTHLPELAYKHEQYVAPSPVQQHIIARVLADLEGMYPGQIRGNRVLRSFLHTREGIVAARPGAWAKRAPQHVGLPNFVLAGDWTQHGWGVCMEGAVRSGQLAADGLLAGKAVRTRPPTYAHLAHSLGTLFQRA